MMLTRTEPTMTIVLLFLSGFIKFEIILGGHHEKITKIQNMIAIVGARKSVSQDEYF